MTLSWLPQILKPIFRPLLLLLALKVQWDMRRILDPIICSDLEKYKRTVGYYQKVHIEQFINEMGWLIDNLDLDLIVIVLGPLGL